MILRTKRKPGRRIRRRVGNRFTDFACIGGHQAVRIHGARDAIMRSTGRELIHDRARILIRRKGRFKRIGSTRCSRAQYLNAGKVIEHAAVRALGRIRPSERDACGPSDRDQECEREYPEFSKHDCFPLE